LSARHADHARRNHQRRSACVLQELSGSLTPNAWKFPQPCALSRLSPRGEVSVMSPQLKLIALDAGDLAVISTHVQDARVQPSDIIWRQGEKRVVVGMSRLDWEQTLAGEAEPRRLVSALRFDRVLACKSRNIDLAAPET